MSAPICAARRARANATPAGRDPRTVFVNPRVVPCPTCGAAEGADCATRTLPPALVARLAQAHSDASDLMLETHRLRQDAIDAGADELTLARLAALQLAADTAWRLARQEHARHDPAEAARQEEGRRQAELHADEVAAHAR